MVALKTELSMVDNYSNHLSKNFYRTKKGVGSNPTLGKIWFHRSSARISHCHCDERGSIPLGTAFLFCNFTDFLLKTQKSVKSQKKTKKTKRMFSAILLFRLLTSWSLVRVQPLNTALSGTFRVAQLVRARI
jgi:hypothetical protein